MGSSYEKREIAPSIIVNNFSCKYKFTTEKAISNLNFSINKGEIIGVVGKSGCGKTTLLYNLIGIIPSVLKADLKGIIKICGLDTQKEPLHTIGSQVQMVFQTPESTFFTGTVFEEIIFGLENKGVNKSEIDKKIEEILPYTNIKHLLEKNPYKLSSGEQQKVALTSALISEPAVLLLDEPTAYLDTKSSHELIKILENLSQKKGTTILIAEHDTDFLYKFVNRFIILDKGKIISDREKTNTFDHDIFHTKLTKPTILKLYDSIQKIGYREKKDINIEEISKFLISKNKINFTAPDKNKQNNRLKFQEKIISIEDLNLKIDGIQILKNINLTVDSGDFLGIIGENGAGKTTLINCLMGIIKKYTGSITIGNCNPKKDGIFVLSKKVGFVYQNPLAQLFADNVLDEVAFRGKNFNIQNPKEAASSLIKKIHLSHKITTHPTNLSVGEQRRVTIISQLISPPNILIVDEPTIGLDYRSTIQLMNILKEYNEKGNTVIVVSHDLDVIAEYANSVAIIKDGEIKRIGNTANILSEDVEQFNIKPSIILELAKDMINHDVKREHIIEELYQLIK